MALIPMDQVFFILAQVTALLCALLYRYWDNLNRPIELDKPPNDREQSKAAAKRSLALLLMTIPGLAIVYLCYGSLMLHLVLQATVCYLALLLVPAQFIHVTTLAIAMTHLSYLHLDRLLGDQVVTSVDITAPVMVLVQKVTSVAFALYDGQYRAKKSDRLLSDDQKGLAITAVPSVLEYAAYVFNFQTVICGPLAFYGDFIAFIDGTKIKRAGLKRYPSARKAVATKLAFTIGCAIMMVTFVPIYPPTLLTAPAFAERSFLSKLMLIYWVALAARMKYYFAWTLSEAISNASGLGFSGVDEKTKEPVWELMNNIDIVAFENSFNQRDAFQVWNRTTEIWLRRTAYDRLPPKYALFITYILSAIWHGFHPGYYLTFLLGAIFTVAARVSRRCLRFRFLAYGEKWFTFYHLLTWITTKIALSYLVIPFILLEFFISIKVYTEVYFFAHLVAFALIFALPLVFPPQRRDTAADDKVKKPTNSEKEATVGLKYLQ